MPVVTQSISIRATVERVFDVIADFERYPEFLPEIEEAKIVKKGRARTVVAFTANMVKQVRYTLDFQLARPSRITWTLVEADPLMKGNSGSWRLKLSGPSRTEATFSADVELGIWMPKMILEGIAKTNLAAMLEGFKKRAEVSTQRPAVARKKRARAKSGHP